MTSAGSWPRLLAPHLAQSRGALVVAAVAFVVKDSPRWVMPVLVAEVIDVLVARQSPSALILPAGVAAGVIALNVGANVVYVRTYSATVRSLGARLRSQLAERLQVLSLGFHQRSGGGVVQTKLVRDVENVELMLQQSFGPVLNAVSILIGASVTIAVRVPVFLPLFALTVPLAVVLIRWLRGRTSDANERLRREVEQMSAGVSEMAALMPITRAHGLEVVALEQLRSRTERVRAVGYELDRLNGRFGAMSWAGFQLLSMSCLFGAATLALSTAIPVTAGDVVLLSTYFSLLTGTLVGAFQLAPLITRGLESIASVDEVLAEDDVEDNEGKPELPRPVGALRFDAVTYRVDGRHAVDDLSLDIRPGESLALVGPSGAGKSTVLNLALGLLRPSAGRVLVDGVPLEAVDLRTYRRHVSVVPQEPVLLAGSIRDNVAHGLPGAEDDRVWDALEQANAAGFVRGLPDGWHTPVAERGTRLSGGQRQRIAIARALARDPRLLLLDEATSALDPESELAVQGALERLRTGRTTLLVAHRLSTVRSADRIAVLDEGRLVELGTHDELVAGGGPYEQLVRVAGR